eukprot:scaffold19029_cov119-Isochrysis_galbana.AAC.7
MDVLRGPTSPGWSSLTYYGNSTRSIAFYLFTPEVGFTARSRQQPTRRAGRLPLLTWLHGGVHAPPADQVEQFAALSPSVLQQSAQTAHPCFVLQPFAQAGTNFVGYYRSHPREVLRLRDTIEESLRRVIELIEALLAARPRQVDPARLVLAGASMGAYGTWDLLVRFPGRFAAAVAMAGGGDPDHPNVQVLRERIARRELRLWAFHSLGDRTVTPNASRRMFHAIAHGAPTHARRRQHRLVGAWPGSFQSEETFTAGGWLVHTEYGGSGDDRPAGERRLRDRPAPSHGATFGIASGDPRLPGWLLGAAPEGDWER